MRSLDKTMRRLLVLAAISVVALGTLAIPALADNFTEAPSDGGTEDDATTGDGEGTEDPESAPDVPQRVRGMPEEFAEALAAELDLPVDRVTDAIAAAKERLFQQRRDERLAGLRERLDAAVADGDLTQEQADAVIAAIEEGVLPFGPDVRMHAPGFKHHFEDGPLEGPRFDGPLPDGGTSESETDGI